MAEGRYDLVGPDGEIILPKVWKEVIQPDWSIIMHLWPIPEPPPDSGATLPDPPVVEVPPIQDESSPCSGATLLDSPVVEVPPIQDEPYNGKSGKKQRKRPPPPIPPPVSLPLGAMPSPRHDSQPMPEPISEGVLQDSPTQPVIDVQARSDDACRKKLGRKRESELSSHSFPPPGLASPPPEHILSTPDPQRAFPDESLQHTSPQHATKSQALIDEFKEVAPNLPTQQMIQNASDNLFAESTDESSFAEAEHGSSSAACGNESSAEWEDCSSADGLEDLSSFSEADHEGFSEGKVSHCTFIY